MTEATLTEIVFVVGTVFSCLTSGVFCGFLIGKARRNELDAWLNRENA